MKSIVTALLLIICYSTVMGQSGPSKLIQGTQYKFVRNLTVFKNKLLFVATDSIHGSELWSYDTLNPPAMLFDLAPGTPGGVGKFFLNEDSVLYFSGRDSAVAGMGIFKWDGQSAPQKVMQPNVYLWTQSGGVIYYFKSDPTYYTELWSYHPVTDTSIRLTNFENKTTFSDIFPFNGKIYFVADTSGVAVSSMLYEYDPATGDTQLVTGTIRIKAGISEINSKLYYFGLPIIHGELYSFDGTTALQLTNSISDKGLLSTRKIIKHCQNKLYFWSGVALNKERLAYYDLLSGYVHIDSNFGCGRDPFNNQSKGGGTILAEYHDKIYTSAFVDNNIWDYKFLYSYVDSNASPVMIDSTVSYPEEAIVFNDDLYFIGRPVSSPQNTPPSLYRYNDKDTGTSILNLTVAHDAKLYPNPTGNTCTMEFSLASQQRLSFVITDAAGKVVYHLPVSDYASGKNHFPVDTRNLAAGIYHCRLATESNALVWSGKLLKE